MLPYVLEYEIRKESAFAKFIADQFNVILRQYLDCENGECFSLWLCFGYELSGILTIIVGLLREAFVKLKGQKDN